MTSELIGQPLAHERGGGERCSWLDHVREALLGAVEVNEAEGEESQTRGRRDGERPPADLGSAGEGPAKAFGNGDHRIEVVKRPPGLAQVPDRVDDRGSEEPDL